MIQHIQHFGKKKHFNSEGAFNMTQHIQPFQQKEAQLLSSEFFNMAPRVSLSGEAIIQHGPKNGSLSREHSKDVLNMAFVTETLQHGPKSDSFSREQVYFRCFCTFNIRRSHFVSSSLSCSICISAFSLCPLLYLSPVSLSLSLSPSLYLSLSTPSLFLDLPPLLSGVFRKNRFARFTQIHANRKP